MAWNFERELEKIDKGMYDSPTNYYKALESYENVFDTGNDYNRNNYNRYNDNYNVDLDESFSSNYSNGSSSYGNNYYKKSKPFNFERELEKIDKGMFDKPAQYYKALESYENIFDTNGYSRPSYNNNFKPIINENEHLDNKNVADDKKGQWDDNYYTKKNINETTEKIKSAGEEPVAPKQTNNDKGFWGQLLDIAAIGGLIENTIAKPIADDIAHGEWNPLSAIYNHGKGIIEADDKLGYVKEQFNRNLSSITDGVSSGWNTLVRGLDLTDKGEYEDKIIDIGEGLDYIEKDAIENDKPINKFAIDVVEKYGNPLYHISKGVTKAEEWVHESNGVEYKYDDEQREEVARGIGNLFADVGLGILTGNVTDIGDVGKGIKYLTKADEIADAEKIVKNTDKAVELAKKSNSFDDFKKYLSKTNPNVADELADEDLLKAYDRFIDDVAQTTQDKAGEILGTMPDFKQVSLGPVKITRETLSNLSTNKLSKGLTKAGLSMLSPTGAVLDLAQQGLSKINKLTGGKVDDIADGLRKNIGGTKFAEEITNIKKDPTKALEGANHMQKIQMEQAYKDEKVTKAFNFARDIAKGEYDNSRLTEAVETGKIKTDVGISHKKGDVVGDYNYNQKVANSIRDIETETVRKNYNAKVKEITDNPFYTATAKNKVDVNLTMLKNKVDKRVVDFMNDGSKKAGNVMKEAMTGDIKKVAEKLKENLKGVDDIDFTRQAKSIVKSYNKVNENANKIINNDIITKGTHKVIDDLKLDRSRLSTKSKKERYMKEIRKEFGNEVANKVNKELRIEKQLSTLSKNFKKGIVDEENISKLQRDLYSTGSEHPQITDEILDTYEKQFPKQAKKIQEKQARYKTLEKDIRKIEYLDSKKVLTPKETEIVNRIQKEMGEIAVEEGIIAKADVEDFGRYVYHKFIGNSEDKKILKQINESKYKKFDANNPHEFFRNIRGSVRNINEDFGKKMYEDNITTLYIERKLNNAKGMYERNVMKSFFDSFGTRVNIPKFDSNTGKKVPMKTKKAELKKYIDSATKNDEVFIIKEKISDENKIDIYENISKEYLFGKYTAIEPDKLELKHLAENDGKHIYKVPRINWNTQEKTMKRYLEEDSQAFIKVVDNLSNIFKTQALMSPRYTVNNFIGNVINTYTTCGTGIVDLANVKHVNGILKDKKGSINGYSYDEIRMQSTLSGLSNTQISYELASGNTKDKLNRLATKGGNSNLWEKTKGFTTNVNNWVEDKSKIANVVALLREGNTLSSAIESTKKALFDYSDLTDFETKTLKRIVPFYTFMRKNAPLQLDNMINNPAKFYRVNKIVPESQSYMTEEDRTNLPEYMQDYMYLGGNKMFNLNSPSTGAKETLTFNGAMNSLNPYLKVPFELYQNRKFFNGKEVSDADAEIETTERTLDYAKYITDNAFPLFSQQGGNLATLLLGKDPVDTIVGKKNEDNDKYSVDKAKRDLYGWSMIDPTKVIDTDRNKKDNLEEYEQKLNTQYDNLKDRNPKLKDQEKANALMKKIRQGEYQGYDMTDYKKELEKILDKYN